MPWLRLWTDILDDVDIHALTLDQVGAWTLLLAAAKKHNRDGALPPIKTLAFWVHHPVATVESWINGLVTAGFIDGNGVTFAMHGWEKWQEPQDKTNAARQARFKAKRKAPPPPPSETETDTDTDTEQTVTATPLPNSVTVLPGRVCDDLEPFDPGGPDAGSAVAPPAGWTAQHQAVLDRQTQRFGASNGDRVIADLLRDFAPRVVTAACDHHYADTGGTLDARRLLGICKAMRGGRWAMPPEGTARTIPIAGRRQEGPTNMPPVVPEECRQTPEQLAAFDAEMRRHLDECARKRKKV